MIKPALHALHNSEDEAASPTCSVPEGRIRRRIEVFEEWIKKGRVPLELAQHLPRSLTQLMKWSVPSLGIVPSTNPHDYTREHKSWGSKVKKAEKLMGDVLGLVEVPKAPVSATERVLDLREAKRELKHSLELAVDQYHKLAHELVEAKRVSRSNADIAKALTEQLDAAKLDLEKRDGQIAELRRELHALQALPRIAGRES
ncbi:hypothetical protein [Paucibacter sp. M5-1]|uniref:hypothetical protein n=1 Tax=Paucibacter sp. M5-1 TaxID=3015998 RepID=UPI0022B8B82A|nr:hypothetical protein [Paucibacter sp. M5-1]MCZ7884611.1 hypothetical protein [Paucibacter sp. M5-1]